jgi:hypothetical protein
MVGHVRAVFLRAAATLARALMTRWRESSVWLMSSVRR